MRLQLCGQSDGLRMIPFDSILAKANTEIAQLPAEAAKIQIPLALMKFKIICKCIPKSGGRQFESGQAQVLFSRDISINRSIPRLCTRPPLVAIFHNFIQPYT